MRRFLVVLVVAAFLSGPAGAYDAEVELTEDALNRLVRRLADPSDGGVYQPTAIAYLPNAFEECDFIGYFDCPPPGGSRGGAGARFAGVPLVRCRTRQGTVHVMPAGAPVSWQWWVMGAQYKIAENRMTLTATVRWRVDKHWEKEERTVDASFELDAPNNRLRIKVGDFKVPVRQEFHGIPSTITEVDVAKLLGVTVPIPPRTIQVPLIDGGTRNLTGRATGIGTDYLPGKARVKVDVAFN